MATNFNKRQSLKTVTLICGQVDFIVMWRYTECFMDIYDFGDDYAQTYTEKCQCGEEMQVSTQKEGDPEFTTIIYIKCCKCGESVCFHLPVA